MKPKISAVLFILILVLIVTSPDLSAQCAMCRKAVSDQQGTGASYAQNINNGILYLMSVPYFALAFIFRKQIGGFIRQLRSK